MILDATDLRILAQLQHESLLKSIENLESQVKDASVKLADAKRGREDDESGERAKKMARKEELSKANPFAALAALKKQ